MGDLIYFRDYQKPVAQPASLLAKATTLVGFINALTAKDYSAAEQSHYHNLAEPILDTAPSEYSPPEAS